MNSTILKLIMKLAKIGVVTVPFVIMKYKSNKREKALEKFNEVFEKDDYHSSLWYIDKYLKDKPNDGVAHLYKAIVLMKSDKEEEAFDELKVSIELEKNVYESRKLLGDYYQERGMNEEAEEQYKKAIKLRKEAAAYYNLGLVYYEEEDYKSAIKYFKLALKYHKGDKTEINEQLSSARFNQDLKENKYVEYKIEDN